MDSENQGASQGPVGSRRVDISWCETHRGRVQSYTAMLHGTYERALAVAYLDAKAVVLSAGYDLELCWQDQQTPGDLDLTRFLRECAWVILSSGMRTAVVAKKFDGVCRAFHDFHDTRLILARPDECIEKALALFRHQGKIAAILAAVRFADGTTVDAIRAAVEQHGAIWLNHLPYIGPATSLHLAKNLGFDVAKPDRHLSRICENVGCSSVQRMCEIISEMTGDRVSVVDLVLWRFSTLDAIACNVVFESDLLRRSAVTLPTIGC